MYTPVKKEELVYKSNELIEAQYNLSAIAQKVAAVLISKVDPKSDILPIFSLSVKEYANLLGITPQVAYRSIDKVTTELKQVVIIIKKIGTKSFVKLGMFRECHYDDDEKIVRFEFEQRLEPHLKDFSGNFTKYQVKQIKKIKSRYSIRMYEILRKVHPINRKSNRPTTIQTILLEDLKKILGANSKTHKQFAYFRKDILNTSKKQLAEMTDLIFDFKPIRHGKKVGSIQFVIKDNVKFSEIKDDLEGEVLPDGYDEAVATMLKNLIPELPDDIVTLLASRLDAIMASRAFLAYKNKLDSGVEVKNPDKYFMGILKKQQEVEAESSSESFEEYNLGGRYHFKFDDD